MSTKHNCSCLDKAADDEPIFVLRAQDKLAPLVVEDWIRRAAEEGTPMPKLAEAQKCAEAMKEWHTRKIPD